MKISELIKRLQTILETDGDVEVKVYPYDGQMNPSPVEEISEVLKVKTLRFNDALSDWDREPCEPFIVIE